jgi:hypothetical protein
MNRETESASTLSETEQHLRELVEKHAVRYEINLLPDKMGDNLVESEAGWLAIFAFRGCYRQSPEPHDVELSSLPNPARRSGAC